jgi:hypothetical protein
MMMWSGPFGSGPNAVFFFSSAALRGFATLRFGSKLGRACLRVKLGSYRPYPQAWAKAGVAAANATSNAPARLNRTLNRHLLPQQYALNAGKLSPSTHLYAVSSQKNVIGRLLHVPAGKPDSERFSQR